MSAALTAALLLPVNRPALAQDASPAANQAASTAHSSTIRGADEGFFFEIGGGIASGNRHDSYQSRLNAFDFKKDGGDNKRLDLAVGRRIQEHVAFGLEYFGLDIARYLRDVDGISQKFLWNSRAVGGFLQGDFGFGTHRMFDFFARGGLGVAFGGTSFDVIAIDAPNADADPNFTNKTAKTHRVNTRFTKLAASLALGVDLSPSEYLGFQFLVRQSFVPGLENALGDTHDLGDLSVIVSLRLRSLQ